MSVNKKKQLNSVLKKISKENLHLVDDNTIGENKDTEDELGGLFRVLKSKSEKYKTDRATINKTDCSKFELISKHDWDMEEVCQFSIILYYTVHKK